MGQGVAAEELLHIEGSVLPDVLTCSAHNLPPPTSAPEAADGQTLQRHSDQPVWTGMY